MIIDIAVTRLTKLVSYDPKVVVGLGGNRYVICSSKFRLECFCYKIEKAPSSIYWSIKYNCWTIRVKSKYHKMRLAALI